MEELPVPKAAPTVQKWMEERVRRLIALSRRRLTLANEYLGFLKRTSGLERVTERLWPPSSPLKKPENRESCCRHYGRSES